MEGSALSMQEVRVVAPIKEECAFFIHIQHGRYQAIQGGTINCMEHSVAYARTTLEKGSTIHIDEKEHCVNTCIQIGSQGYMREDRYEYMHAQPTVHPADMKQFQHDKRSGDQTAPHKDKRMDDGHQRIHDQMVQDICDSEDIIQKIRDSQDSKIDFGMHFSIAGVIVSVLTVFSLLLI
jgi:uncharacterized FlaG/YvyC family protein